MFFWNEDRKTCWLVNFRGAVWNWGESQARSFLLLPVFMLIWANTHETDMEESKVHLHGFFQSDFNRSLALQSSPQGEINTSVLDSSKSINRNTNTLSHTHTLRLSSVIQSKVIWHQQFVLRLAVGASRLSLRTVFQSAVVLAMTCRERKLKSASV